MKNDIMPTIEAKKTDASLDRIKSYLTQQYPELNAIYKLKFERGPVQQLVQASIDRYNWQISIKLDDSFEEKIAALSVKAKLKIDEPVEKALHFIAEHEVGHWKRCPKDMVYGEIGLSAISKGLKAAGLEEQRVVQLTPYVANMFFDVIDNTLVRNGQFREGAGIFYTSVAYTGNDQLSKPNFKDYYALFVDCQFKISKDGEEFRDVGEKYSKDYTKLKDVSKQLIETLLGNELAEKAIGGKLSEDDIEKVNYILSDENRWRESATQFAKIIAPFVKDEQKDMEQNVPLMPMLQRFKNDNGFRKRVIEQGLNREGQEAGGGKPITERGSSAGNSITYATNFEVFDQVYRQASGQIVLEFIGRKGEGEQPSLDIFHMNREQIDKAPVILPKSMAWDRTLFLRKGNDQETQLFEKKVPYSIPIEPGAAKSGSSGDLLFLLDVSGSMSWSGQPLDGSKYDMCLRTVYSIINYLEISNKAANINYGLAQFGVRNRTTWDGWKGYEKINELRTDLFKGYQNAGETVLESSTIDTILSKRNRFMAIVVTDGAFSNEQDATKACIKMMETGNSLVLFELNEQSNIGGAVREAGGTVIHVDDPNDLVGINLRIVAERYKRR